MFNHWIRTGIIVTMIGGLSGDALYSDDVAAANARPSWTKSRIKGSPEKPSKYRVVSAFPKLRFQRPTSMDEVPGADRLMVTEVAGNIFTFLKDEDVAYADLVIDLRALLPRRHADGQLSLFSATLHPRFRINRYLFVCYVHPVAGRDV